MKAWQGNQGGTVSRKSGENSIQELPCVLLLCEGRSEGRISQGSARHSSSLTSPSGRCQLYLKMGKEHSGLVFPPPEPPALLKWGFCCTTSQPDKQASSSWLEFDLLRLFLKVSLTTSPGSDQQTLPVPPQILPALVLHPQNSASPQNPQSPVVTPRGS